MTGARSSAAGQGVTADLVVRRGLLRGLFFTLRLISGWASTVTLILHGDLPSSSAACKTIDLAGDFETGFGDLATSGPLVLRFVGEDIKSVYVNGSGEDDRL